MVKFGYTINYVSDVERALSFFEKAFAMKRKFITDEKDYGELETGETVLSFASHDLGKSNFQGGYVSASESKKPLGIEIALITDNVASTHSNAIGAGAVELKNTDLGGKWFHMCAVLLVFCLNFVPPLVINAGRGQTREGVRSLIFGF